MHNNNVAIITTCSNRKRQYGEKQVRLEDIQSGDFRQVLENWCRVVSQPALSIHPAEEVYIGRAFLEAKEAARLTGGGLWIISAGLGLVRSRDHIPSYDLSVSGGGPNDVRLKIDGTFDACEWWAGLNKNLNGQETPLAKLFNGSKSGLFVVSISSAYYKMVEEDLHNISEIAVERLRLIGLGLHKVVADKFKPVVMPYDERFDGPDSPIRGTRTDFAQRGAHHFVEEVLENGINTLLEQRRFVSYFMKGLRIPNRPDRRQVSDEHIMDFILKHVSDGVGSGKMLRFLRDSGISCEQGRFSALYKKTMELRFGT